MTGLDLAVIGNCTVASVIAPAGIAPAGRHVWFCFPRLDADPVFNPLLGGAAAETGFQETRLRDQTAAEQCCLPNTAVLDGTMIDACTLLRAGLGLLSEDISPDTGALRGNFPQIYFQVGLIFAAMRLSRTWEAGLWRAS